MLGSKVHRLTVASSSMSSVGRVVSLDSPDNFRSVRKLSFVVSNWVKALSVTSNLSNLSIF